MPDEGFVALVRESHEALLRLADLLEEDPADAEDLVRAALAYSRLRRSPDPLALARTHLVRRHVRRRSGRGAASGFVRDGWTTGGEHEGLRRALADLPPRTRAAVVLHLHDGLSPEHVAEVLRASPDSVAADLARGTTQLEQVLVTAAVLTGPAPAATDVDVRAELHRLVQDIERPPLDALTTADDVLREATAGRWRRGLTGAAVLGTVAAAAAAAVVLPGAASRPAPAPAPAPRDVAVEVPGPVHVYDLPTRGSLAGDTAFLDGLLELPWQSSEIVEGLGGPGSSTPTSRRVLFAGDVPGGRWALLVGTPDGADPTTGPWGPDDRMQAWFTGPVGASPGQLRLSSFPYGIAPEMTPALLDPDSGTLVVVAAPGDEISVSERSIIAADGSRSRPFEAVPTTDGIGMARLDATGVPFLWSVIYRVTRGGGTVMSGSPDGLFTSAAIDTELPAFDIRWPRGRPDAEEVEVARQAALGVLAPLGLGPDDAEIVARWTGPVPEPGAGTLAVVTVTVPSGAQVVTVQWWLAGEDGSSTGGECGLEIRPADPRSEQRLLAAACEIRSPVGEPSGSVLVALAPPSAGAVRTYDSNGSFLGEHAVDDGVVVTPLPPGTAQVEGVTAGGVLLGRTDLLGHDQIWG